MKIPSFLSQVKQFVSVPPETVVQIVLLTLGALVVAVIIADGVIFYRYAADTGDREAIEKTIPTEVIRVNESIIESAAQALRARQERLESAGVFSKTLPDPFR